MKRMCILFASTLLLGAVSHATNSIEASPPSKIEAVDVVKPVTFDFGTTVDVVFEVNAVEFVAVGIVPNGAIETKTNVGIVPEGISFANFAWNGNRVKPPDLKFPEVALSKNYRSPILKLIPCWNCSTGYCC